jgi:hypothetical protein
MGRISSSFTSAPGWRLHRNVEAERHFSTSGREMPPMTEWTPEDIKAHIDFQNTLNQERLDRGELVDAQASGLSLGP